MAYPLNYYESILIEDVTFEGKINIPTQQLYCIALYAGKFIRWDNNSSEAAFFQIKAGECFVCMI